MATALLNNVDELHTFDRNNLIGLSNQIQRKDGVALKICKPPAPPAPAPLKELPLFQGIDGNEKSTEDPKAAEGAPG